MRERPAKIFAEARANLVGKSARLLQPAPEVVSALRQPKGFELCRIARPVCAHQDEVAQVRYQYETVAAPVPAHLIRFGGHAGVVLHTLHLDDASLRDLSLPRAALLDLLRRVEGIVRMAGTLIRPLENAEHLGLQRVSDCAKQVRQRRVVGALPSPATRGVHPTHVGEVRLDRRDQLLVRTCHRAFLKVGRAAASGRDPVASEHITRGGIVCSRCRAEGTGTVPQSVVAYESARNAACASAPKAKISVRLDRSRASMSAVLPLPRRIQMTFGGGPRKNGLRVEC